MKIEKNYESFENFMQDLIDIYVEKEDFSVLCDDRIANKIAKKFLTFNDNTRICVADFELSENGGYLDEYHVANIDNDLYIEKARRNNKLLTCCAETIVFVQKDFVQDDFFEKNTIPSIYFLFSIKEEI